MKCAECGGTDVLADAYVEWNDEAQAWEIQNVFTEKGGHCETCDGECRIEESEID